MVTFPLGYPFIVFMWLLQGSTSRRKVLAASSADITQQYDAVTSARVVTVATDLNRVIASGALKVAQPCCACFELHAGTGWACCGGKRAMPCMLCPTCGKLSMLESLMCSAELCMLRFECQLSLLMLCCSVLLDFRSCNCKWNVGDLSA